MSYLMNPNVRILFVHLSHFFLSFLNFKSFPVPPMSLRVPAETSVSIRAIGVMECLTAETILMNKAVVCHLLKIKFSIIRLVMSTVLASDVQNSTLRSN